MDVEGFGDSGDPGEAVQFSSDGQGGDREVKGRPEVLPLDVASGKDESCCWYGVCFEVVLDEDGA